MEKALKVIQAVEKIVSPIWLIGGSCRDILLEREPHDWDFTTPLLPDDVEKQIIAAGRHCNPRGKRFGTLGCKVEYEPGKFVDVEITTLRSEKYHPNSRKPDVEFIPNLNDDILRRDFRMNAIALNSKGEFYDLTGGRLDILAKRVVAVGDARERFQDDPLRMLRAARFGSQLGFTVDPNLIGKTRAMAHMIGTVSKERWCIEIDKLLVSDHVDYGIGVLLDTYLMKYILPEVMASM